MAQIDKLVSISKKPANPDAFLRPSFSFLNARSAFKALLQGLELSQDDEVLLPSYIGWSEYEGSGVFDPIQEVGMRFSFYRVTRDLMIDFQDLSFKLATKKPKLLLLIHYFGYPDPNLEKIASLAHKAGVYVLEDEAHALFSDWIGGVCGRFGNAAIFSLHKMLPFESGGMLLLNDSFYTSINERLNNSNLQYSLEFNWRDYDLMSIATARRQNALYLLELLKPLAEKLTPLYSEIPTGVVPQSLPVLIHNTSRDKLYFTMNESGYGVVSLYHTLIQQIKAAEFSDSHWLSRRILNLPVHQDVSFKALEDMVAKLGSLA